MPEHTLIVNKGTPAVNKINMKLGLLLYVILVFLATYILLSKSMEGFYQAHIVADAYLPNLGIDSPLATVNARTFVAYVALVRVMSLVCGTGALDTTHIMAFLSVLYVFLSYILLLRVLPGDSKTKQVVAWIFPIFYIFYASSDIFTGSHATFSLFLTFIILFFFLRSHQRKRIDHTPIFIAVLILWIAIGFFWQTSYVMVYVLVLFFMLVSNVFRTGIRKGPIVNWALLGAMTITFFVMWFYFRQSQLTNILETPGVSVPGSGTPGVSVPGLGAPGISVPDLFNRLFSKGSFTGVYSFRYPEFVQYIDGVRYVAFLAVYIVMALVALRHIASIFKKKGLASSEISSIDSFITVLLISNISFQFLYFVATGTAIPLMLITLVCPFMLIYLNNETKQQPSFLTRFNLNKVLTALLVVALVLTAGCKLYGYIRESPSRNLDEVTYQSSFFWIVSHSYPEEILSDAATSGTYQLLYSSYGVYKDQKIKMRSINYGDYKKIANLTYENTQEGILVLNTELYKKHLLFRSLQDWNIFEPLPPQVVAQNGRLDVVYNDGRVLVAK